MFPRKCLWHLRRLQPADEAKVMNLFKTCLAGTEAKEKMEFDYWTWENKQNPDGYLILIAEHEEKLVGYYSMIYRRLKLGDKIVKAAFSIDNMVHPQYRRQGMFMAMVKQVNDLVGEEVVPISLGFPNEQARPGYRKVDWLEVFKIPTMVKIINSTPIVQALLRNNPLSRVIGALMTKLLCMFFRGRRTHIPKDLSINTVSFFDSRFDKLWASASKSLKIVGIRDSRRLNWRFIRVPHRKYIILTANVRDELQAYVVLRTVNRRGIRAGLLIDMLAAPGADEALLTLIKISEVYFLSKKAALIFCIMLPGWYSEILRRAGFIKLPKRLEPTEWIFIVRFNEPSIDKELIKNPHNWHITFEDTDVL